jgi:tetratricopeptide (TPR) repeat protein
LQPDHASAWFNKGVVLGRMGRYDEELASFERALELQPDDADTWGNKGVVLGGMGRYEEALASFERSLQLQPDNANASFGKGMALDSMGHNDEALASYEHALQSLRSSGNPLLVGRVSMFVFTTRVRVGQLDQAKHDWRSLVDLSQDLDEQQRQEILLRALRSVVQQGHLDLARQLAGDSGLEGLFFPLIRALDYATTGDRALIEKLPPELRSVVEEIVAELPDAKSAQPDKAGSPKGKNRRRRSSSRTRKKLS